MKAFDYVKTRASVSLPLLVPAKGALETGSGWGLFRRIFLISGAEAEIFFSAAWHASAGLEEESGGVPGTEARARHRRLYILAFLPSLLVCFLFSFLYVDNTLENHFYRYRPFFYVSQHSYRTYPGR